MFGLGRQQPHHYREMLFSAAAIDPDSMKPDYNAIVTLRGAVDAKDTQEDKAPKRGPATQGFGGQ